MAKHGEGRMHDRPTSGELIAAARLYLEQELIPALTDARLRFQTLVAANVLAISERELQGEEEQLAEEWQLLGGLLGVEDTPPERLSALKQAVRNRNERLCAQIRAGEFDEPSRLRALCTRLRRSVE